ncbi:hypothetical protein AWB67_06382 [Caballeronia terrestris]|uniref:DUF2934 domain-containing protein n=1 Tax=Caballeronia terrestris TaxID=1226301 RepID=A0A158KQB6_9BURK|nr:DUF2934 domain-containing protein [Caballeronia terrestris]SAL83346.1 hypothetical protein AWB67_06382 [Caballeronia terrestris]
MALTVAEDHIRTLAHLLWEEAGRPEGRSDEFWNEAQRQLASEPGLRTSGGRGRTENTAASG